MSHDPVANVLPLGDLYSPLLRVSDVHCAISNKRIEGVCTVYRALPKPSVVLGITTPEVKLALLTKVLSNVSREFITLCSQGDRVLFEQYADVAHCHLEQQMIADPPSQIERHNVKVEKVRKEDLNWLNEFFLDQNAEAWVPIQFEAGPYYCVKHEGKIVSAAGVHLVTPRIAQLGNIVTDEAYRSQGFATACTNALAGHMASKGRIISLFVRTDNIPAIRVYEKLGFHKVKEIVFLIMHLRKH